LFTFVPLKYKFKKHISMKKLIASLFVIGFVCFVGLSAANAQDATKEAPKAGCSKTCTMNKGDVKCSHSCTMKANAGTKCASACPQNAKCTKPCSKSKTNCSSTCPSKANCCANKNKENKTPVPQNK
jgi:hypothetical protein